MASAFLRQQVLARPETFDVAVTTYEMVNSAEFGRPIQATIVSGGIALLYCARMAAFLSLCMVPDIPGHVGRRFWLRWQPWGTWLGSLATLASCLCTQSYIKHRSEVLCAVTFLSCPSDLALFGAGRGPPGAQHGHTHRQGAAQCAARQRAAADR